MARNIYYRVMSFISSGDQSVWNLRTVSVTSFYDYGATVQPKQNLTMHTIIVDIDISSPKKALYAKHISFSTVNYIPPRMNYPSQLGGWAAEI